LTGSADTTLSSKLFKIGTILCEKKNNYSVIHVHIYQPVWSWFYTCQMIFQSYSKVEYQHFANQLLIAYLFVYNESTTYIGSLYNEGVLKVKWGRVM